MQGDWNVTMEIKIKIQSNKRCIMKKIEKIFFAKENNSCMPFGDLVRSYVELEKKVKSDGRKIQ